MPHPFTCEQCHRERTCSITGCKGDCTPLCGSCINKNKRKRLTIPPPPVDPITAWLRKKTPPQP